LKRKKWKKQKTSLLLAPGLSSLSELSLETRPPAFLPSLRRPATMSKTIALFDVDGTLTVPRKVGEL
jgi:hypothetical protein